MRSSLFMAVAGNAGQTEILGCCWPLTGTRYDVIYLAVNTTEHFRRQAILTVTSGSFADDMT